MPFHGKSLKRNIPACSKERMAGLPSHLRLALGSLIIQTKYQYSDRELVEQLTENPYYQYFIGLPGYQEEPPIDASTLVLFRKRLKMDVIMEANEYMLDAVKEKESSDKKDDDHNNPPSGGEGEWAGYKAGTVP